MPGLRLGSVLGFEIRIDYSWFVIAFLVLWSLSAGVFPDRLAGLSPAAYFVMGTLGTLLFFASLLAHELSHSVVARTRGVEVAGITLFVFGGMAHTKGEAENPDDELAIAGVGPLCSLVLAAVFWLAVRLGGALGWPEPVLVVGEYLALINLILALFNLLPGFPLDGGRLFRALVWRHTGDLTVATRWATRGGKALGYGLMGLGGLQTLMGGVVGGLWMVFIGWFLRTAALTSFEQHLLSGVLTSLTAERIMTRDPSTVEPDMTLQELVETRLLREPHQGYPVLQGREVLGLVTLGHVRAVPRDRWPDTRVRDVMTPGAEVTLPPGANLQDVLSSMSGSGTQRVLVVDPEEGLVGVISASDVSRWLQKERALGGVAPGGEGEAR
jgi:Zn-dependent protease/CBS domain-containing protein